MRALVEQLKAKGAMLFASVELTARCPLECRHCYLGGQFGEELSTERHLALQDELAAQGCMFLLYTGGEVFLREDLELLIGAALKKGFGLALKTSAYLATPEQWLRLKALGLRHVHISFYGADEATHDGITQRPGSFRLALDSALFLQDQGLTVKAVFTPMRGAEPDPEKLRDGLRALGLRLPLPNLLDEISCEGFDLSELYPSPEQERRQAEYFASQSKQAPGVLGPEARVCSAGVSNVFIRANGEVLPCHRIERVIGDLRRQRFQEIWTGSPLLAELRALRYRDLHSCQTCADAAWCSFCFGAALRDTGTLTSPSPKQCHRARLLHEAARRLKAKGDTHET